MLMSASESRSVHGCSASKRPLMFELVSSGNECKNTFVVNAGQKKRVQTSIGIVVDPPRYMFARIRLLAYA